MERRGFRKKKTHEKYIRRKLIAARKRMNLSQKEVANMLHISPGYYTHIENGRYNPSALLLIEMGKVLGISNLEEIMKLQENTGDENNESV